MAATGWRYVTDYTDDPNAALQTVRQDVFEQGDYLKPGQLPVNIFNVSFLKGVSWLMRLLLVGAVVVIGFQRVARWVMRGFRGPRTIDEVLLLAGEWGTHSILDITHISVRKEFAAAMPLSDAQILRKLGTTKPTEEDFQQHGDKLMDDLDRWEAVYFPLYQEGSPYKLAFVGVSGD